MNLLMGFGLALLAGVTMGFAGWFIKWARVWRWENFWLVYSIVSMIVAPFALAYLLLPHLNHVYGSLTTQEVLLPFGLGILWGFAQLGGGICLYRLGVAVQGAVLNGVGVAVGTLVPLIMLHRNVLFQNSGLSILVGIAAVLSGVTLCGWSGCRREQQARSQGRGAGFSSEESAMSQTGSTPKQYILYLGIAIGSGALSSLLNIALAYSSGITGKVINAGGLPTWAPFAVWPIALLGGSIVSIVYCVYLLSTNKTWGCFNQKYSEAIYPTLTALMWMGGIALYSSATTLMGTLGISIGFAVFTVTMIICNQLVALFTGEWHLMQRKIYRLFYSGITCLVLAVVAVGIANYYQH
jgi:L-rhamnose-H+ transport protein